MFEMLVTTNYNHKLFEKGKSYLKTDLPEDTLNRWLKIGFIKIDNETIKPKVSRKKKQPDKQ
jgi:hypothetical protein